MAKSLSQNQQIALSLIREMVGDTRTGIVPLRLFNERLKPLLFPDLYILSYGYYVLAVDRPDRAKAYAKIRASVSRTLRRLAARGYIDLQQTYIRVKRNG